MPSKKYNGNSPLQGLRLGSFADVELEVAKRSPRQALTTGVLQTPSGAIHTPKRRRRSRAGAAETEWRPWECRASTTTIDNILKNKLVVRKGKFGDYTAMPPTGIASLSSAGTSTFVFDRDGTSKSYSVCLVANYEIPEPGEPEQWVWSDDAIVLSHEAEAGVPNATTEYEDEERPVYPIASIRVTDDDIRIRQLVYTNLGLVNGCFNGDYIKMLAPV